MAMNPQNPVTTQAKKGSSAWWWLLVVVVIAGLIIWGANTRTKRTQQARGMRSTGVVSQAPGHAAGAVPQPMAPTSPRKEQPK